MAQAKGRAWTMERASVHNHGKGRQRFNKFSGSDSKKRPATGSRSRIWVGGYVRADGTKVSGHYRAPTGNGASG